MTNKLLSLIMCDFSWPRVPGYPLSFSWVCADYCKFIFILRYLKPPHNIIDNCNVFYNYIFLFSLSFVWCFLPIISTHSLSHDISSSGLAVNLPYLYKPFFTLESFTTTDLFLHGFRIILIRVSTNIHK